MYRSFPWCHHHSGLVHAAYQWPEWDVLVQRRHQTPEAPVNIESASNDLTNIYGEVILKSFCLFVFCVKIYFYASFLSFFLFRMFMILFLFSFYNFHLGTACTTRVSEKLTAYQQTVLEVLNIVIQTNTTLIFHASPTHTNKPLAFLTVVRIVCLRRIV